MSKKNKNTAPMSESVAKFRPDWTQDDCVDELKRIAELDTERVVTRNYFRNHARCSEATWNQFFGTFSEFKRQAGIILTRQQNALERAIAKHASVDHYREMSRERQEWGEKYERSNRTRFQTLLVASDLHDHECDAFFLEVLEDTAKRARPDVIVLNGDIFDLPEFGKYHVDPREWGVVERIQFVHERILRPLREACPDAQIDFIEGNHEARLLRHLADSTPALRAVLSDLHGFTVPKLLGLDEFEVNYVAKGDLATYTLRDQKSQIGRNYKVYFDCFLAHHFPEGKRLGLPGVNGHHHRTHVETLYSEPFGAYQWVQLGCGHMRDATFCNGEKWDNSFMLAHVDTQEKRVNPEIIPITTQAVVGGQFYYREAA